MKKAGAGISLSMILAMNGKGKPGLRSPAPKGCLRRGAEARTARLTFFTRRCARGGRRPSRAHGQAALEALIVSLVLVALLFGHAWWDGETGVAGVWLRALDVWYRRFAAAVALPV